MGIKNVNETAKEKSPAAFCEVPVTEFKGKRIVIDTPIWIYANMGTLLKSFVYAMKDPLEDIDRSDLIGRLLKQALRFHLDFLEDDVTPIWCKDGKTPTEKAETRKRRKEGRENTGDKMRDLKKKISEQDLFERNPQDLKELRNLMANYIIIHPEEFELFYNTLASFGLPVIIAPGETEMYAAAMNLKGLSWGTWTTDTDYYVAEGINMIKGCSGKDDDGKRMFECVNVPKLLEGMGFTAGEMRDFGIMCGTDFNDNIPNLGAARAFKFITEYRCIEDFAESKDGRNKDVDILNYERSRELLTPPECELVHDSVELKHNAEAFYANARDLCSQYNMGDLYAKFMYHMDRDIPVEVFIQVEKKPKSKIVVRGKNGEKKAPEVTSNAVKIRIVRRSPKKEEDEEEEDKNCKLVILEEDPHPGRDLESARVPLGPARAVVAKPVQKEVFEELE
jgi:5'-3' exonuclease